jgi:hypothetical protein
MLCGKLAQPRQIWLSQTEAGAGDQAEINIYRQAQRAGMLA